jgi:hypothetical protein
MITEFFKGEVYVYLKVLRVPTGRKLVLFLGLILNSIKILSLLPLCIICFSFVYYLTLKALREVDLLGGEC